MREPKKEHVWGTMRVHVLYGTHLQLHPSLNGRLWYVVDDRDPNHGLSDALPLSEAKRSAERQRR